MRKLLVDAGARATIEDVKKLRLELAQAMEGAQAGDELVVATSHVRKSDSSFAQLLIAAELEAKRRNIRLVVEDSRGSSYLVDQHLCGGNHPGLQATGGDAERSQKRERAV